jgi:Tfp pilus assembly protein PilN
MSGSVRGSTAGLPPRIPATGETTPMLRINLLPPYIYDKQKKVRLGIVWAAIVAATLFGFLFVFVTLNKTLADDKDQQTKAEGLRADFEKVEADITKEKQARAEIERRQVFIASAQKYNDSWSAAFEMMRDVTANNILLKSMAIDKTRKTVSFTGFAKTEEDIVRWWEYLRNNYAGPDATLPFDNVSFSLPGHPYPPKGSAAAGGAPGSGGFAGPRGGLPSMAGFGGPSSGGPSSGGGSGGFGGSGGGAGNDTTVGPGSIEGRPGINFTASVVLKKALAEGIPVPVWSAGAAPAAPAAFGAGPAVRGAGAPSSGGGPGGGVSRE